MRFKCDRIDKLGFASLLVALVGFSSPCKAGARISFEDEDVVQRSELVVVGRLEANSLKYKSQRPGGWYEYGGKLVVSEVIKGKTEQKELPIVIHYGLTPVVGGRWEPPDGRETLDLTRGWSHDPKRGIEIADTGNCAIGLVVELDAAQNNLWFLRRLSSEAESRPDPRSNFGICDPEDVQPLKLKGYFQCYLSNDASSCVREQLQRLPEISSRATHYLAHLELNRIAAINDPAVRVERALPYWMEKNFSKLQFEAEKILIGAGPAAGPYLMSVYDGDNWRPELRERVIELWGRVRYRGCVDALIEQLKGDDQFWKEQHLEKNWRSNDVDSELSKLRRNRYGEDYRAVMALGQIEDPRARPAVQMTRNRWAEVDSDTQQIIEACDTALRNFNERNNNSPAQPDGQK